MALRIGITGVSGFIGKSMALRCVEEGFEVRGLDISEAAFADLNSQGVLTFQGDIQDAQYCEMVFQGCEVVFHAAALTQICAPKSQYRKINVEGTRSVITAAQRMGVSKLIHLSSIGVYGFNFPENADEATPMQADRDPYFISKIRAEGLVNQYHKPGEFEIYVVRPGDVYGPDSVPWVQRPLELMKDGQFYIPGNGEWIFNHVHIDNLLDACVQIIKTSPPHRVYNIVDDNLTSVKGYFERLAQAAGFKKVKRLPLILMKTFGFFSEMLAKVTGKEPKLSRATIKLLTKKGSVSNQLAKKDLNYLPKVDLDSGFKAINYQR